jgi:hypothetical protein
MSEFVVESITNTWYESFIDLFYTMDNTLITSLKADSFNQTLFIIVYTLIFMTMIRLTLT